MDSVFFWFSKIIWGMIRPDSVFISILIFSWLLIWKGYKTIGLSIFGTILILLFLLTFVPLGQLLLKPLEFKFPTNPTLPQNITGIIVLSGAEDTIKSKFWNQVEMGAASERNIMFMKLAKEYPHLKKIFTGGSGSLLSQELKQAEVAKKLFLSLGIDTKNIIFESDSRNTYENALFSKKLVKINKNENWLLITSAWHMPRSVGVFCSLGWPVLPFPVDHLTLPNQISQLGANFSGNLSELVIGMKEWVGLTAYFATGKINKILPSDCMAEIK
ncbi:YdcF family protein [Candidatus Thioglobus sp.]|nr:YdcF family protein [Candidatus Thioglobus sp.]